jgi:hypothetical protein
LLPVFVVTDISHPAFASISNHPISAAPVLAVMASQTELGEKPSLAQIEKVDTLDDDDLGKNAKIVQTQDSRFAAVIAQNKPNPWSKSLLRLYPILVVAFANSAANGFDVNLKLDTVMKERVLTE